MDVTWNDDYNTPFGGSLNLAPSSGDKDKAVSVSDGVNEGLDRHATLVVQSDADPTLMEEVVVKQEGKRIPFCTGDGVSFRTGDAGTFNVLKSKADKIIIDQTNDDPIIRVSGDVNGDIIQYIRNNSHRVLAKKTAEGEVAYAVLDDTDSTKYTDGTPADLTGTEGDVFVKLPKFYYKGTEGDIVNLFFASKKLDDDYIEWDDNTLIGVYESYSSGGKAYSRSNVGSTGNISQQNWKKYAIARGSGYQLVDWQMHCVMGCLYYAMYGNTDCRAEIGTGTNSYSKNTGQTNNLGMEDTKASTNGNNQSINFWGLENWWGNKYEWIDDYVNSANTLTATVNDPVNGGTRNLSIPSSGYQGYYPKKMKFGRYCDLVATNDDPKNGTSSTGYADLQWWPGSTSSSARVVQRSSNNSYEDCGVAYAYAYNDSSKKYDDHCSRLAFRGVATEAESVEAFKQIPIS